MSEHVTEWLSAYHDGALEERRLRQVKLHLLECEACRAALDTLQKLSALLQESPAPATLTRPDRFVAQVGLRLPRRQEQPPGKRALGLAWRLMPVGLLGAWVFSQTLFLVAKWLMWVWRTPVGGEYFAAILPVALPASFWAGVSQLADASLLDVGRLFLQPGVGWETFLQSAALILIGICYCSWLASWWAYRRHLQGRELKIEN
ncbi:MAG TPA: hypothetical protein ENN19_12375 [Chloroflexi bacterium]|nr:hypothetical protein [Chloroflexota bacterium]